MMFCWNAFNNGFRDFAFLDLGSRNDYTKHSTLAFQIESVVPIVSVSIDITLLTKFCGRVDDGAGTAIFYQNSFSWDDYELKFDFFMASDNVDGREFFGGYPLRLSGSNCQGGAKD